MRALAKFLAIVGRLRGFEGTLVDRQGPRSLLAALVAVLCCAFQASAGEIGFNVLTAPLTTSHNATSRQTELRFAHFVTGALPGTTYYVYYSLYDNGTLRSSGSSTFIVQPGATTGNQTWFAAPSGGWNLGHRYTAFFTIQASRARDGVAEVSSVLQNYFDIVAASELSFTASATRESVGGNNGVIINARVANVAAWMPGTQFHMSYSIYDGATLLQSFTVPYPPTASSSGFAATSRTWTSTTLTVYVTCQTQRASDGVSETSGVIALTATMPPPAPPHELSARRGPGYTNFVGKAGGITPQNAQPIRVVIRDTVTNISATYPLGNAGTASYFTFAISDPSVVMTPSRFYDVTIYFGVPTNTGNNFEAFPRTLVFPPN
jgi:hypothetical protein